MKICLQKLVLRWREGKSQGHETLSHRDSELRSSFLACEYLDMALDFVGLISPLNWG